MKNKLLGLVVLVISIFAIINLCGRDDNKKTIKEKTNDQYEILQATAQITLKNYGYRITTSSLLEDWNINKVQYNDSYHWTIVTYSDSKRLKWIFEWTGEDKDDLILLYLLVGGKEVVNDLRK